MEEKNNPRKIDPNVEHGTISHRDQDMTFYIRGNPTNYTNEGFVDDKVTTVKKIEANKSDDSWINVTPKTSVEEKKPVIDRGWSWFVCLAGFFTYFVLIGIFTSFGKVFDEFLKEFKRTHSETAWIGSLATWGLVFFGGIASFLSQKLNCRTVVIIGAMICATGLLASSFVTTFELFFLTYSLTFGFGSSLCYTNVVSAVSIYFDEKRSIALGLVMAGSSSGTMAMNPVFHHLFEAFGWRTSFRVCSGMCLLMVLCGMVMRPQKSPSESEDSVESAEEERSTMQKVKDVLSTLMFDTKLLRSKSYSVWLLAMVFAHIGYFIPYTYMILYAKSIDISPAKASMLFTFYGVLSTLGRVFWGIFSQLKFVNTKILMQLCMFFMGTVNFLFTTGKTYYYLATLMSIFGFLEGCFSTLVPIVTLQISSGRDQKSAFGTVLFFQSFSMLLGPPTAGWVYAHLHTYDSVFYFNAIPLMIASLLTLLLAFMGRVKARKSRAMSTCSCSSTVQFSKKDWNAKFADIIEDGETNTTAHHNTAMDTDDKIAESLACDGPETIIGSRYRTRRLTFSDEPQGIVFPNGNV